jgi:PAS domain-containing protein
VTPVFPLELHHSWPLFEQGQRFDLGLMCEPAAFDRAFSPIAAGDLRTALRDGPGTWSCDLADNSLIWSDHVFALFGLPCGAAITRAEAASLYREESRAAMERLRAYAIRHRRGFVLDAAIDGADGRSRWMRLIAAPVLSGARVTGLRGLKLDVSATYR